MGSEYEEEKCSKVNRAEAPIVRRPWPIQKYWLSFFLKALDVGTLLEHECVTYQFQPLTRHRLPQ